MVDAVYSMQLQDDPRDVTRPPRYDPMQLAHWVITICTVIMRLMNLPFSKLLAAISQLLLEGRTESALRTFWQTKSSYNSIRASNR